MDWLKVTPTVIIEDWLVESTRTIDAINRNGNEYEKGFPLFVETRKHIALSAELDRRKKEK